MFFFLFDVDIVFPFQVTLIEKISICFVYKKKTLDKVKVKENIG